MEQSDRLAGTARWAAAVRARESTREDRLFDDPWARELAGDEGMAWVASRPPESVAPMTLRTRFFDDYLRQVTSGEGPPRQVVLLAAGLDTRAFRLEWPSADVVVFEVDRSDVLAGKAETLTAASAILRCAELTACPADLSDAGWPGRLVGSGFDPAAPSVWVGEGLFYYLATDAVERLLEQVSRLAAPGSALGFDAVNSATFTHPLTSGWVGMQAAAGAPWLSSLDDPAQALAAHGWLAEVHQFGEPQTRYGGRWPVPAIPADRGDLPHYWLVTARKLG